MRKFLAGLFAVGMIFGICPVYAADNGSVNEDTEQILSSTDVGASEGNADNSAYVQRDGETNAGWNKTIEFAPKISGDTAEIDEVSDLALEAAAKIEGDNQPLIFDLSDSDAGVRTAVFASGIARKIVGMDNVNGLAVKFRTSWIAINRSALSEIAESGHERFTLSLNPTSTNDVNELQSEKLRTLDIRGIYKVSLAADGAAVAEFENAASMMIAAIPIGIAEGTTDADYKVYRLSENGELQLADAVVAGGILGIGARQFSDYVVVYERNPFEDVREGDYYYKPVLWAMNNNITKGTTETAFAPEANCTRAQMVTFLWRAAGSPTPNSPVNPFTDVSSGDYFFNAVLWAVENGITTGTSATTFSPDANCTRAQTVTFIWRYAADETAGEDTTFTDIDENAYYAAAVKWAVQRGITTGTSETTFSPDADCTRAQIVTFLYRSNSEK